ncbi:MAG: hypothetical protein RL068_940, partial [Actinomycetota bacterium]
MSSVWTKFRSIAAVSALAALVLTPAP